MGLPGQINDSTDTEQLLLHSLPNENEFRNESLYVKMGPKPSDSPSMRKINHTTSGMMIMAESQEFSEVYDEAYDDEALGESLRGSEDVHEALKR